tara:strand:+ start:2214 stop:3161 length:948 start_codon:yes stop_codon:yes gene_type:complete
MNKILIVTVTYGDRLSELVNGAFKTALKQKLDILVVCNGVTESYYNELSKFQGVNVKLLRIEYNSGSAGGFNAALLEARKYQYDYYLLLDDDNFVFEPLANINISNPASFIYRAGRSYMEVAMQGRDPSLYFAKSNSFLGFDFFRIIKKKFFPQKFINLDTYDFPWCPYGGLIINSQVLHSSILPKSEYFLYCDDTEYTSRISVEFGLKLIKDLRIVDYEDSWNVSNRGNVITRIFSSKEAWRVFYSIRNQANFDYLRRSSILFWMNFSIFLGLIILYRTFSSNGKGSKISIKLIFKAVRDGMKNKLGDKGFDFN